MKKLKASYDPDADVLYLNLGEPVPIEGDGLPRGVELDYAMEGGQPCGVTVIGYNLNGWNNSMSELAMIAAAHLSVSAERAAGSIASAVGGV
jgi:uncharacterized protein YuzE